MGSVRGELDGFVVGSTGAQLGFDLEAGGFPLLDVLVMLFSWLGLQPNTFILLLHFTMCLSCV